jgi:hypothetical protein
MDQDLRTDGMPDEDRPSRSKTLMAAIGTAAALITALGAIGILQFKRTDEVTPYQQQVHAACNRIQDMLTRDAMGELNPSFSPDGAVFIDKASLLSILHSNYQVVQLQLDLLDHRPTPSALKEQKRHEEDAKQAYLATFRDYIQLVQRDMPDHPPLQQLSRTAPSSAAAVTLNDALSALAGGDCSITGPRTGSPPTP